MVLFFGLIKLFVSPFRPLHSVLVLSSSILCFELLDFGFSLCFVAKKMFYTHVSYVLCRLSKSCSLIPTVFVFISSSISLLFFKIG